MHCGEVPTVFPYNALENFPKALYGGQQEVLAMNGFFRPVMSLEQFQQR